MSSLVKAANAELAKKIKRLKARKDALDREIQRLDRQRIVTK